MHPAKRHDAACPTQAACNTFMLLPFGDQQLAPTPPHPGTHEQQPCPPQCHPKHMETLCSCAANGMRQMKSCRCTHQVRPLHQLGGEHERRDDAVQSPPRVDSFHGLPAYDLQKLRWKEPSTGKGGGRHATQAHRNTCTRSGSWPLVYEIEH